jgi:threonylcarbamoyladenosine tRNA methylthiotransferase MtaB
MKVSLLTLGCRVNQSETSIVEGTLKENGITIVNLSEKPDFCVINTCTVTSKSDYNSRQLIRRAVRTGARVIVTGCYSQLKPDEVKAIPGVFELVDNIRKYEIVETIVGKRTDPVFGNVNRSRPYLKVQNGCNFRCSYCSVPLARGRSESIPLDEAVRRAKLIEDQGYNEIVLTGIHLGAYGRDLKEKSRLADLIRNILLTTTAVRLRLSSLEINEVTDELIELLQEDRICEHLHLPLQSGNNKILNLMNRHYTVEYFSKRLNMMFSKVENIALGSDIIVGFPEEGEEEFAETFAALTDLPFSYLHVFPFSPRPHTEAANMKNRPPHSIVKKRVERLKELNELKKKRYLSGQINRVLDVVVEERIGDNTISGTSSNYLKIAAHSERYSRGSVVAVRSAKIVGSMLMGIVIP